MRIGFEFIADESPLTISVAEELQEKYHIEILGVTLGNRFKYLLKSKEFELISLSDYLEEHWENYRVTKEEISEIEEKYGDKHDLWLFINVDRFINDINKNKFFSKGEKLKFLCINFKFWEEFFNRYNLDGFYSTGASFLTLLTGMAVAQRLEVNFKAFSPPRLYSPKLLFVNNYLDRYEEVNRLYSEIVNSNLPSEKLAEARKFIADFRENPQKPYYENIDLKHMGGYSVLSLVKEFFRRFKWIYMDEWGKSKFDYFTSPLFKKTFMEIGAIVKRELLYRFYFEKNSLKDIGKDKYAFLPLQVQPEESTDIWGMYYSNQIAFVENVAKSLPLSLKLYVKEHSGAVGRRKRLYGYYKEIDKLTNVELIHPLADTYQFIRSAEMVIVSSGTVGWEALLLKTPVIMFGEGFYKYSNLVYSIDSFIELKRIAERILHSTEILPRDYDDKLEKFVYALNENICDGHYGTYYCGRKGIFLKENIENISSAILKDCGMLR